MFFFLKRTNVRLSMFLRPLGALQDTRVKQISDLHRGCGAGMQTVRESKIRGKAFGGFTKPVWFGIKIHCGLMSCSFRGTNNSAKEVVEYCPTGVSPCPEMFYMDVLVYFELCSLIRADCRSLTFHCL